MVFNSSIGIRHEGLILAEFGKHAVANLYTWCTDKIILVYMFKVLLSAFTDSFVVNSQGTPHIVLDFSVIIILKIGHLVFMYYQNNTFPNNWIGGSIKRMRKVKDDVYKWKDSKLKDVQVGDIVKLRYEQVSPFDILILDTSELRYNDNILSINEGTIRGDNRLLVKRAIRNLDLRASGDSSSTPSYLSGLAKKLNGYVEYDPPSGLAEEFKGTFKLKNDPKVAQFTEEHMILCGAKVYSKEAIGMVLFTGANTRVFQKSNIQLMGTHQLVPKRPVTYVFANKMAVFMFFLTFIVSVAVLILGSAGAQSKAILTLLEEQTIGYSPLKKLIAIWASLLNVIPGAMLGIPDLYCLLVGIYLRKKGIPKDMFTSSYPGDDKFSGGSMKNGLKGRIRDVRRAKIGTIGRAAGLGESEGTVGSNKQIEIISLRRMSNTLDSSSPRMTRRDTKRFETSETKSSSHSRDHTPSKPERSELNDKDYLRIVNCTVLPDLGYIDQVFFDKTDTLTSGRMKVAELSTYQKCYEIPAKEFASMITECSAQPDLYAYEDENAANKESGDYSEKSQE